MSFSTAPPGAGRRRRDPPPQRELTAANLAQQRTQPFEARMPPVKPKDGERHGLPLGRDGAVCALCGNPGHDADVCADRPAPRLRISLDLDDEGEPAGVPSQLAEEPSMTSIPDSPSALFPKPTPEEALAMRRKLEALEAKRAAAEAEKREKQLRALDELHRDATDQGGPRVHSRFDPYPLSPKRTFKPPPTREEILAAEAAAAEAEAEAKAIAEEAAGEASRKPPLPKLDASLEGSEVLRGVAGLRLAKQQAEEEAAEEAARARRAAEREKAELARAKRAARLAALEAETSGVPSASVPALEGSAEGSGGPGVRAADGEGDPAKPPSGDDETAEKKSDAGADPDVALDPLKAETDPKRRAVALMEAKAARNPLPGGGPSGLASDLRQPVVTEARPVADDDVAVATTVADAVANVVQTGIQPDFKLYEPEGGFQGMLQARKAAERDAEEAREALAASRREAASASMALFEERERHAHDLERSVAAARAAGETAAAAALEREEAVAEMHALRARCDAELADTKADAEANVEAARLASSSVAEEARKVRETLEETRASAAKEAGASRDVVASLRRQLERAETSARVAAEDAARALESTQADLASARAEIARADARAREATARADAADDRADAAEARAAAAESAERRLAAVRRKAAEAAGVRAELESRVTAATSAAAAAGAVTGASATTRNDPSPGSGSGGRRRGVAAPPGLGSAGTGAAGNSRVSSVDPAVAAARRAALREAAEELDRENAAAARARSEAKRVRRKAVEAEASSAASEASAAPAYLRAFRVSARAFFCAGDAFAASELRAAAEAAGFAASTRPAGADAAPARARAAESFVLVDSAATRADEGARLELGAAIAAGRRVFVAYSERESEVEARERWHDVDLANAAFVPHDPQSPSRVLETLAAAAYLGVPDAFLEAMSPSTLQALADDPDAPDFVSLRGARALALRFERARGHGPSRASRAEAENGRRRARVHAALVALLESGRASTELRTIKTHACAPEDAAAIAAACCRARGGARVSVSTLGFGGLAVPVGAIRDAGRASSANAPGFALDLTAFDAAAAEDADFGIGACELAALRAALAAADVAVAAVTLPPWVPAEATRAVLRALGADDASDAGSLPADGAEPGERAAGFVFPTVNGVPPSFDPESDTVDLSNTSFGVPGAVALARALKRRLQTDAPLATLAVGGAALGAEGGAALAAALRADACASLRVLSVPNAALGASGVEALCDAVPATLTTLDIGNNGGGDRTAAAAAKAMRRCPALQRLGVASCDVTAEGACRLAPAIRDHACVREVQLDANRIGDRGAAAIAAAVRATSAPFERLRVRDNVNMTAAAAKAFASAMAGSGTLRELDASKAAFGAEGAKALCAGLAATASLEILELSGCRLRAEGAKWLGDAVAKCATLRRLGVSRNSLGDKGVFELTSRGLDFTTSLSALDLSHNAVGPEGARRLRVALERRCVTVRALEMEGNKLEEDELSALVETARRERAPPPPPPRRLKPETGPEKTEKKAAAALPVSRRRALPVSRPALRAKALAEGTAATATRATPAIGRAERSRKGAGKETGATVFRDGPREREGEKENEENDSRATLSYDATEPPESTRCGGDSEDDADDDATDAEPEADPTRAVEPREEDETDPSAARFTLPEPSTFVPPTAFVPRRFSETAAAAAVADPDETRTDRVPEEETFGGLSEDPVKSLVDGILKKVARTDPGVSGADAKKTRDPPKKKKSVAWTPDVRGP